MMKVEVPKVKTCTIQQKKDVYCYEETTQVGLSGSDFHVDHNRLLVRTCKIDCYVQKVAPILLKERIRHAEHYLKIAGHAGE